MFDSNLKDFEKVVYLLSDLIKQEEIRVLFRTQENLEFIVLESARKKVEKLLVDDNIDFKLIINGEVSIITVAILTKQINVLKRYYIDTEENESLELENKIELIDKLIVDDELRQNFLLKATSKNKIFSQLDWEVNEKTFDDTHGNIPKLKYALLKISSSTNNSKIENILPFPLSLSLSSKEDTSDLCFACNASDIDHLISILTDIKKALKE